MQKVHEFEIEDVSLEVALHLAADITKEWSWKQDSGYGRLTVKYAGTEIKVSYRDNETSHKFEVFE
jgi:hypothetical protein